MKCDPNRPAADDHEMNDESKAEDEPLKLVEIPHLYLLAQAPTLGLRFGTSYKETILSSQR